MRKAITILVDDELSETYTGFDQGGATDDEIFGAMSHLACILYSRGILMDDVFAEIKDVLENTPMGVLN